LQESNKAETNSPIDNIMVSLFIFLPPQITKLKDFCFTDSPIFNCQISELAN